MSPAKPRKNDASKSEKAFTEKKRRSKRRKRVYRAHTFLAKANTRLRSAPERRKRFLPRENDASKGEKAFT